MRIVAEATRRQREIESSIRRRDRRRIIRDWALHRQDGIFGTDTGIDSSFYESMVLLDDIIEVLRLSQLSAVGEDSFFLQLLDRRRIGCILIDVDHSRR